MDSLNSFVNHGCFLQPLFRIATTLEAETVNFENLRNTRPFPNSHVTIVNLTKFPTSWSNFLITWGDGTVKSKKSMCVLVSNPSRFQYFHVSYLGPRYSSGATLWVFRKRPTHNIDDKFPSATFLSSVLSKELPALLGHLESQFHGDFTLKKKGHLSFFGDREALHDMEFSNWIFDVVRVNNFQGCVGMNVSVKLWISCVSYFMLMSLVFASGWSIFMPCTSIQFCFTTNLTYRKSIREITNQSGFHCQMDYLWPCPPEPQKKKLLLSIILVVW